MRHALKPRILIIDDEPSIGELLRRFFGITNEYVILSATDSSEALQRARVFRPDLMILDVNMPEVDGVELARAIRREPWLRHRPIVFYTAMSQRVKECWHAAGEGPTVFLPKGTSLQDLFVTVEQLVSPRRALFQESFVPPAAGGQPILQSPGSLQAINAAVVTEMGDRNSSDAFLV